MLDAPPAFPPALRVLLVVFTVLTVVVVLAVNALGRAEARDDVAVLEALGAAPRTRRTLAAASAALTGGRSQPAVAGRRRPG